MKHENENRRKVKSPFLAVLAVVLVCAVAVGGTLAYLTASQEDDNAVVNTFLAAGDGSIIDPDADPAPDPVNPDDPDDPTYNVDLQDGFFLVETLAELNDEKNAYVLSSDSEIVIANNYNSVVYDMPIAKNPKLTVDLADNVSAYIFVKVTDTTAGNFVWEAASDWTEITSAVNTLETGTLAANEHLYVYKNAAQTADLDGVSILSGDSITAKSGNNSAFTDIDTETDGLQLGNLTFEAYACQSVGFDDAAEAYLECFGN